ncbi:site-specific integrase [Parabacteroides sp. 52]|uniref:site-specific integrase n=1 Tax=unclassified Parabacteroides TaxID=2649774 RepID=UPI0013D73861|nr:MULTISPECIES: site-specific integrase [unclassified Parabacteroides]MDH6535551.1 integrase [Parabacteroides sp. PM5-20]NDV56029.1 site-specific integrase [Parabacteroides sp. 52]
MSNELKVSFYLKRESRLEKRSDGESVTYPIIGKIIIGNSIAQFSSKLSVSERLWNVKSGRAIGKSRIAVELNREINKINLLIHSHYKEILHRTGTVTATEVKITFQGIATAQKTLLVHFKDMAEEFRQRIGIDRSANTYPKYNVAYKNLKRFLNEKYHIQDIPLNQLDLPFIEAYDFYLRVERKLKAESIVSIVALLLKAVRIALHRNIITYPPFLGYKLGKPEFQQRSLSAEEFERLISTPLKSTSQSFIRDLFVFAAFTGLSFIDLKQLTWKDIVTEEDGSRWISMSRQKTDIPFNVKLLDIPTRIMEKYRGISGTGKDDTVFNVLSHRRISDALKVIAKHCNITTNVSFHVARHCFASQLCLSQGVPIESVSRMMGHRNIQTTQRYARVNNEKIGNDMKRLSQRLAGKFNLPVNNQ